MTTFAKALIGAALLALAACGDGAGTNQAAADNAVATSGTDNLTLPPDETGSDTLGNQLNALETENALGNQVSDNGVANSATSADTNITNTAGNAQ